MHLYPSGDFGEEKPRTKKKSSAVTTGYRGDDAKDRRNVPCGYDTGASWSYLWFWALAQLVGRLTTN